MTPPLAAAKWRPLGPLACLPDRQAPSSPKPNAFLLLHHHLLLHHAIAELYARQVRTAHIQLGLLYKGGARGLCEIADSKPLTRY